MNNQESGNVDTIANIEKKSEGVKENTTIRRRRHKNLVGKSFGEWKVKESAGIMYGGYSWKCQCVCGCEKIIRGCHLISGATKSCGCRWKQKVYNGVGNLSGQVFSDIKREAERRNLSFQLTKSFLWELFLKQNGKCALSGVDIDLTHNVNKQGYKRRTASLDRKDSSKGYIEGNVWWVHKNINNMKQTLSVEDFVKYCQKVATYFQ